VSLLDDEARIEPVRDAAAVSQFVERFAAVLTDAGFVRMPARVFVALLATDSGRLTAAELAQSLQVSPAAVSGAVRYLGHLNLASRERDPGSRRDHYRVHDDVWYEASLHRDQHLHRWRERLAEGIAAVGADTAAGRRLAESLAFITFLEEELPGVLDRWKERKAALRLLPTSRSEQSPSGASEDHHAGGVR
jgi:DNA-binding transcriptional regulator GbsR (MarR family)